MPWPGVWGLGERRKCAIARLAPNSRYDFFPKHWLRRACFARLLAVSSAFLRTLDTAESDTFSVVVVQDFERVVVEDGDDRSGEVGSKREEDVE